MTGGASTVAFPTQKEDYIVPARSRTASTYGYENARRLLRTLSTVSIYESGEGHAGGLADVAPIGKYIMQKDRTGDEAIASEMPKDILGGDSEESPEDRTDGKRRFRV